MGFLNSWPLWSSLAAAGVAVPIIVHLLHRKHHKQMDWAAMELLRRALVVRSGQVKLEDYLVLFLRCLAVLLIAAALLRPTLTSDSVQWLGEKRVGMVVAIDASYSMEHGEHSRYEKAIDKARTIVDTAGEGDPVSVLLMSNRPKILARRTGYDSSVADLLSSQKKATSYRLSLERNLEQLEALVSEMKTPAKECYLITDAQEMDWGKLSDSAQETLGRLTSMATVFLVPIDSEGEDNVSVTQLTYASGSLQKSGVARFVANVRNDGRNVADVGDVEFYVGDELVTRQDVGTLEPDETRAVSFITSFEEAGDVRLRARLPKDELTVDNDRFAVVHVRPSIRVLCVDEQPPGSDYNSRTGAYFAMPALQLLGSQEEGPVQVDRVDGADWNLESLSDYDVVLLANVSDIAPEMVDRLKRFVERGGGLILFLGEQVESEVYNQRFGVSEEDLLPGKLGKRLTIGEDEEGWTLAPIRSEHALAGIVKQLPEGMADSARFFRVVDVEPTANSQTILSINEQDAPLLLTRDVGAGNVLMFTTSADRSWNELAIHPLYTMLLQQAVTDMTSRPNARQMVVGEPSNVTIDGRSVGDVVQVTDPRGETNELKVSQADQRPVCAIDTQEAGVYEVAAAGDIAAVTVAANVDPAESNVRVVAAKTLASQLEPAGVTVVAEAGAIAGAIEQSRQGRELATILLVCGMLMFVAESLLARHFTNRMSHAETGVTESLQTSRVAAARRS